MNSDLTAAGNLAQAIRQVAKKAHSEEDLRVGVERALGATLQALKLTATPEYEKTTLSGSADAVYGHVVIEYKRPGRLAEKDFSAKVAAQLARYLTDQARHAGSQAKQIEALERMIGVGLDGEQMLFLRYSATGRKRESPLPPLPGTQMSFLDVEEYAGGFQIVGPLPVSQESIGLLLLYLRSLARKPLTPEALAADFGPQGDIAPRLVNLLYTGLQTHRDHPRVATFFAEWRRIFGIVYGEELGEAEKDAPELAALYRMVAHASGEDAETVPLQPLFFAVHTYYALLMKFLAVELASLQGGALVGSFVNALPALPDEALRRELTDLENGGTFALLGINNFLEGDFFGWYLDAWDTPSPSQGEGRGEGLGDGIRTMAQALAEFEPATSTLEPEHTRDLLKKLYQYLVPRELRHDLGEYYTPDWLAERLLNQVGYHGELDKRLVDPGCGSGTFPILALRRLRQYAADHLIPPDQVLDAALHNIVGFDLNPLSVIAARTNYLLALGDLLRYRRGPVDLPVYMCDSILTPTEQADMFGKSYRLHTVVDDFEIPGETVAAGEMGTLSKLLEDCVRDQYAPEEFLARARRELTIAQPMTETALEALYRRFLVLEQEGRNGLWARLIKNAFAPVLMGRFDFVVGNPPWVNWESLSAEYREATKRLWVDYGLFSLSGHAARLGGGKKDLSMLFTYAAMDNYLKKGGKLGFVITQTVFKTKGAGDGFRRFRLGEKGDPLRVLHVDDLSRLQPFEGATNRTSVMVCQRGQPTRYPVPYTLWGRGTGSARVDIDKSLDEVLAETTRVNLSAQPIQSEGDATAPWVSARRKALDALQKTVAPAAYEAHSGSCTWANGVYWLKILTARPDGKLVVENLGDIGKLTVPLEQAAIEPDLIYPLIRGRDVNRWNAQPSTYILMVQDPSTRKGYKETWLKANCPETFGYLKRFEKLLRNRSGYKSYFDGTDPFYSLYNVADYTLSPFKVLYRGEVATDIIAAVVGNVGDAILGQKVVLPDQTAHLIAADSEAEAHFVCALMNCVETRFVYKALLYKHPSTFFLQYTAIPRFDPANPLHLRLAALSQQAHVLAAGQDLPGLRDLAGLEAEIDDAAAELWGISGRELQEIRRSLEELG